MINKRLKFLIEYYRNKIFDYFHPLKVAVLIGAEKTFICAYYKGQLLEARYIDNETSEYTNSTPLNEFIEKYKKGKIYIFLDNSEAFIKHVDLTLLESLIPRDIIQNFASKEFKSDHLYSFKMLSLEMSSAEKIQAIFAASPLNKAISYWLEVIFTYNKFRYGNIYFLPLETQHLIYFFIKNYVEETKQKELLQAEIQVLLFITKTTGIRIIAEQNRNILLNTRIKYPVEKSLDFIQGTIEHELSETLLSLKHIVEYDEDLTINLTIATERKIIDLLKESKFNVNSHIIINIEDIISNKFTLIREKEVQGYFDLILCDLLIKNKTYPATNPYLKKLLNLRIFNRLSFKPFIVGILILVLGNVYLKYSIMQSEKQVSNISREYFKNLLEYRKLKGYFTNIEHLDQAIEILLLREKLESFKINPFELLHEFTLIQNDRVQIEHVKWARQSSSFTDGFVAEIEIKYVIKNVSREDYLTELANYIKELKRQFRFYKIDYTRGNGKVKTKSDKISMPIKIFISK
ncbi:MAG: hypothetical protein K0Q51_358 [Rickettsiaceae bacterium]|jgi:hypothetical protein|nr:hypothetical protein [Rickettsiaceae bacterium]